jgi:hypothetical protein
MTYLHAFGRKRILRDLRLSNLSPEAVNQFLIYAQTISVEFAPYPPIPIPGMLGRAFAEAANQILFVERFPAGFIAMARSREPQKVACPTLGDGKLLADKIHATPSPRRA